MDGVDEAAVRAVRAGDTVALAQALAGQPGLATARLPGHGGRTLLHIACDWPGHLPNVAESIAVLVRHGADVEAAFVGANGSGHCTGRRAPTTSTRSTRCSTPGPTSTPRVR